MHKIKLAGKPASKATKYFSLTKPICQRLKQQTTYLQVFQHLQTTGVPLSN